LKHPLFSLFRYWQRHPIASRDLPGTVLRFLRWQLGTRLLEMPVVVPWIGTTSLVIERGMTGATMNVYCGTPAPLIWKVDVEGFEPQVLQGATQALRNPELKAMLLEADTPALQAVMSDAGFSRFVYDPFSRQLQPLSSATQAGSGHNQLWIRDLPFVQQRCRTAAPVRVGRVRL